MATTEQTQQSDFIQPMMANKSATGTVAGWALATSTTAVVVDLTTLPGLPDTFTSEQRAYDPNPLGHFVTLQAEGVDAYVIFGTDAASVSSGNAPVATTTNTVTANVPALAAGVCMYIPAGQERAFKLGNLATSRNTNTTTGEGYGSASPMRFMAVVTKSGTGVLRAWQSSI